MLMVTGGGGLVHFSSDLPPYDTAGQRHTLEFRDCKEFAGSNAIMLYQFMG